MEKSAEAFRTISEVAEMIDVPQHVLRFWETRFTQVRPMKRGGGRRYYRPGDIDLLRGIKHLLYAQGYTIKGVQKLLKDHGAPFVSAIGSGDMASAEKIALEKQEKSQNYKESAQNELFPEGILPESKNHDSKITTRKFFGLLKHDEDKKHGNKSQKIPHLTKDHEALLQKVLFELIECKRLLDRSRL